VPDSHVSMIVQAWSVGKRAYQGWAAIHNRVAWRGLLGKSQRSEGDRYPYEQEKTQTWVYSPPKNVEHPKENRGRFHKETPL
jgi:hypothetical protein